MGTQFFSDDFRNADLGADPFPTFSASLSASFQGQLSSKYEQSLRAVLQNNADWIGFLVFSTDGVDAGLDVKTEVGNGNFTLSGLFGADQRKTAADDSVLDAAIPDPKPVLQVTVGTTVYKIDLTAILSDTDRETCRYRQGDLDAGRHCWEREEGGYHNHLSHKGVFYRR